MHLPTFPRAMPVTRRVQTDFRGYDHRPGCPEGGIYEMTNGSAADAPLFSTRPGRTLTYPTGGGSANGLFAVDGGLLWCTGQTLYFNGTPVDGCTLVNGPKVFAELGGTVLIWPDKVWYRPDMGTFGSAEPSWSGTVALQRSDDSSGARADSVAASGIDTPFRVGDAVTFSGFSTPEDNGTYIIRAIAGAVLVFDPDTFSAVGAVEHITVTRRMPLALHACTYANRIWACAQDTVWCTKLGDPLSWYWYEADDNGTIATAAWSVDVGTPGNFSGCAATGSGVVFLKPDGLWRLYGTKPDNFQLIASAALGTEKNSGRSLVTAAETLYYLYPAGPARTSGGRPVRIGDALGRTLTAGAAGTDGTRWYLSAHDPQNAWHLFVYDTRSGLWSREDAFHASGFARHDGALYAQDPSGVWRFGTGSTAQLESMLETGDFVSGSPDCKRLLRVQLRLEADAGASVTAAVQYDSDGVWHTLATVAAGAKRSVTLPVLPRRCDHFRLRLTGTGAWRLLSLARTEQQRNAKIRGEGMTDVTQSNDYAQYLPLEDVPDYDDTHRRQAESLLTERDTTGQRARIDQMLDALLGEEFDYDPASDKLYAAYRQQYERQADLASANALGAAAALTGGRASTAAVAAAQQAGGYYRAMLAGKLPELAQLAYERYNGERKTRLSAIDAMLDAADSRDSVTKAQIAALLDMDDADYDRADSKLQQQAKDAADRKAAADKKAKEEKAAQEAADKAARSEARRQITLILRNGGTVPNDLWEQSGYSAVTIAAMLRGRKG